MKTPERLPSGRWKVRFRHGVSPKTGKPMSTSESFDTKKQAEEFARWLDALGPQGALDQLYASEQQATVPTLDQVCADHIEHLTGVEDGTRKKYRRLWDLSWGPRVGYLPANLVTRDHIAKAVNELAGTYSRKSLENQRGLLAAVLGRAVDQGHLTKNPSKGIRLPRGKEAEQVEMRILTPTEFDGVLALVKPHYRPFVRFLYGTGCRWGEAVALTVGDVGPTYSDPRTDDILQNVRIRRALKWSPDGDRAVGPTKTRKGNRTVTVGGDLLVDLAQACAGKTKGDLVFTAPRGGMILHRTFWSRVWLPAVSHLDPRPRIHDLRHSHASWLLGNGVPIHVVQARLGHEKITTTVDTYSHLLPDAQVAAAHAASLAFAASPQPRALPAGD